MHTPESQLDAELLELGLDADLLNELADLPVMDLNLPVLDFDIPEVDLDFLDPAAAAPRAPASRVGEPLDIATTGGSAGASSKSVRITIRVPRAVLEGFKARAAPGSMGYQTLMVRALREWLRTQK